MTYTYDMPNRRTELPRLLSNPQPEPGSLGIVSEARSDLPAFNVSLEELRAQHARKRLQSRSKEVREQMRRVDWGGEELLIPRDPVTANGDEVD